VLSILFAALIIIVIADAVRVWWQTLSGRREPVLAEAPAEPSELWAPSGLFPTAEDRARQAELRVVTADDGPAAAGGGRRPLVRPRGAGENAYDHYLAHQRRLHPGEPVLSRRGFECRRLDQMEVRPGQRCC
jgi:hypothetical protein